MSVAAQQPALKPRKAPVVSGDIPRDRYQYWLVLITLVAAVLRFYNLGARGFWEDEGYTWNFVRLPWPLFYRGLVSRAADMTVYYTLMKFWVHLGGTEFSLRALSALFSIATVPIIAELGKRLYSRRAGIIASALFAVHVFAVRYAQETRSYALVMFLAALGWLQLERCIRDQNTRNWLLFSLISLLEIYSHLISGLNVVAQFATLCFLPLSQLKWRPLLRSIAVLAVGVLPGVAFTLNNSAILEWVPRMSWKVLVEFFNEMTGYSGSRLQMGAIAIMLLCAVALLAITWFRHRSGYRAWAASVPVIGFGVPILILAAVSFRQPVFVPRYLGFIVVPLVLGLAFVASRLRPAPSWILSVVLAGFVAWTLPSYYKEPSSQDFRGVVQYIQIHQRPGDALIAWRTMAKPTLDFYASRLPAFPEYLYPKNGRYFMPLDQDVRPDPYTLPGVVKSHDRIWIVYTLDESPLDSGYVPPLYLQRITERTHKLLSVRQFKGLRVEEYSY